MQMLRASCFPQLSSHLAFGRSLTVGRAARTARSRLCFVAIALVRLEPGQTSKHSKPRRDVLFSGLGSVLADALHEIGARLAVALRRRLHHLGPAVGTLQDIELKPVVFGVVAEE